jgi:NADPH-dependent glutamate synthase beta subunit-like oxidoreductase
MDTAELNKLKAALPPNFTVRVVGDGKHTIYNEHDEHTIHIEYVKTAGDAITTLISHYCSSSRMQMRLEMQRDFKKLMGLDEDLKELRYEIMNVSVKR